MKKAIFAVAAVALLLATADTANADHKRYRYPRSGWSVGVGFGGYPYGGWGGPGYSIGYGTTVGSRGFLNVGYSSGFGYGYPAYGYGYGYPAYGYGYAPVYYAPSYYSPYYYGGYSPSFSIGYSRWR